MSYTFFFIPVLDGCVWLAVWCALFFVYTFAIYMSLCESKSCFERDDEKKTRLIFAVDSRGTSVNKNYEGVRDT